MSLTPSTMLKLGTKAPDFTLPDPRTGEDVSLSDFDNTKALLVVFTSNHCPYAIATIPGVIKVARDYEDKGLSVVAIGSNDISNYPEDGPQFMKELAEDEDYPFPYIYDQTQEVAKGYTAACTPDFFLFNEKKELVYRGQLDECRPNGQAPNDGHHIRAALDQLLAGEEITVEQKPSMGCNIKWKTGNEPEYYM